jgi:hypothetical protein
MGMSDEVLTRMSEYLSHAKTILQKDGYVQPTVFASTPYSDSLMILPISLEEDRPDLALDLACRVLVSYNVADYYVVSESCHIIEGNDEDRREDCLNVIYVSKKEKYLISVSYRRMDNGEYFFGEVLEIVLTNIGGSVLDLFRLKERCPRMTEKEKKHFRILFPMRSEEEFLGGSKDTVH